MRLSRYFLPLLKETPAEAQHASAGPMPPPACSASCVCIYVSLVGLIAMALPQTAIASLVISSRATSNIVCSRGTCAPTAPNANLNIRDLESLLASESVVVTTTGSGVQARDIQVVSALTWATRRSLTLDAYQSVAIDQRVKVAGKGGIDLLTDDSGDGGELHFGKDGNIKFQHPESRLSINGVAYVLVNSISMLATDIGENPSGVFAFARNYDASHDGTYAQSPINTSLSNPFAGTLEGLGNVISNLTISDPSTGVDGLFAVTGAGSQVRDLFMANVAISGTGSDGGLVGFNDGGTLSGDAASGMISGDQVGGLAGYNGGAIVDSSAGVGVTGSNGGGSDGGLVGVNGQEALIKGSYASGAVGSAQSAADVGGLVGQNYYGIIRNSSASGTVSVGYEGEGGGLVGYSLSGTVDGTSASGAVSGGQESEIGGLIGFVYGGRVSLSSAAGSVSSDEQGSREGGLVGDNLGAIERSLATGKVNGANDETAGGLVGLNSGAISKSFATGDVQSGDETQGYALEGLGGLVGLSEPASTIKDCYSTGAVSGGQYTDVGGLVGYYYDYDGTATISYAYSTGAPTGGTGSTVGGLVGYDSNGSGSINDSYWDTTTSGITKLSQGVGNISNFAGVTGLTTSELQSGLPQGFAPAIWREKAKINYGLPYLRANPPTSR